MFNAVPIGSKWELRVDRISLRQLKKTKQKSLVSDKINMSKLHIFCLMIFLSGASSFGGYYPIEDANYSLIKATTKITVKADGSFRMDDTSSYLAQNDQGRQKLSQHSHPFLPETSRVRILWAKVKTGERTINVDLKNLENRELPSPSGLSSVRQLIIPFTHVQVGSEVSYRSITEDKNKLIPGFFSMRFQYGLMFPEIESEVTLVSEKPLYYSLRDPGNFLQVTSGKEGQQHTLKITLLKKAFFIPKDEAGMILDPASIPAIDVSTAKDWKELAQPLAEKYEKVLKQPLPALFKQIAKKAEAASTEEGKAQIIISELAEKITYSGNWTTLVKAMFPRGHAEVAKTQNGDCKDYSSSAVAILRSLGIKATVALVHRESPQSPAYLLSRSALGDPALPMLSYFNHAIVRMVTKEGKVLWFDPTNPVSQNLAPFQDIARSLALNLAADVNASEVLPTEHDPDNKGNIDIVLKPRLDGTAEFSANLNFSGQISTSLRAAALQSGKNALEEQLWTLLFVKPVGSKKTIGDYDIKTRAYKPLQIPLAATVDSPLKEAKEKEATKETLNLVAPLPIQALIFAMIGRDRMSALHLGTPAEWSITRTIHGVDTPDEIAGDCLALSKWMDLRRKTYKVPEGLKIVDQFTLKESFIQAEEFKGDEVGYFAGEILGCFGTQGMKASWFDPKNAEQISKRQIIEKTMSLQEGIELAMKKQKHADNLRALRIFENLISQGNSEAQAWIAMPIRFLGYLSGYDYKKEYLAKAMLEANKAISLNANSPVAHQQKTRTLMYQRNFPAARISFATAFKLQPQHFETFLLGGDLFELEDKIDFAEKSYLKALSLAQTNINKKTVYGKLASINTRRAPQSAISYYKASLAIEPDDVWLMNNLAVVYNQLSQWDEAIAVLEKALNISQFGMAELNLANAYSGKATQLIMKHPTGSAEELQKAEVLAMKALKLDKKEHKARGTLGVIYFQLAKRNQDSEALARSMEYFQATFASGYSNSWLLGQFHAAQAMHLSQQMDKTRLPASAP